MLLVGADKSPVSWSCADLRQLPHKSPWFLDVPSKAEPENFLELVSNASEDLRLIEREYLEGKAASSSEESSILNITRSGNLDSEDSESIYKRSEPPVLSRDSPSTPNAGTTEATPPTQDKSPLNPDSEVELFMQMDAPPERTNSKPKSDLISLS